MSLKAKIEAVIYASEEPVTLTQLVGLLGDEAQAELDRTGSTQQTLSLDETDTEATATGPTTVPTRDDEAVTNGAPDSVEPATGDETATKDEPESEAAVDTAAAAAARAEKARMARLRAHFRVLLDQLMAEYAAPESTTGWRFARSPEASDLPPSRSTTTRCAAL